ncbi:shikimate kinase [Peribacillus cavernae]|uniref:Shikimate kinase n=1 Tax=Peribacillus cavernae TaxID=1674310 RepID=A0A3S0VAX0_9BACI|nr:shikimate kinase [Peribacillus cavernae]MDQ0218337.1 shikimate kinase [Peribacillus cavernae]RUQ28384.1 shikimate kinase [Peribacillus cavernae]
MKSIYLTGFMGAGKTTAGEALGKTMDLPVFDTDQEIERQQRQTITAIFADKGEHAFREMESNMLQDLPREDCIITTGGGIVIKGENRQWLAAHGYWVYLHCNPEEIAIRLEHDQSRPLLSGERKKDLYRLFSERLPLYLQAAIVVDTTGRTMDEVVKEIRKRINETEMEHTM